jgi:signal transduction histidine kinase/ligand-binding sensor domain-containing protein
MKKIARHRSVVLRFLLLFYLLALSSLIVRAELLPVKIYTSADGLGSGFVDFLMRDSRGFLWLCTRDGLSRFDGSQFVTYEVGEGGSPGVESIFEARNGVYWIGTTAGLYRFDPNESSTPKIARNGRPILNARFCSPVRGGMLQDRKGNIWIRSDGVSLMQEHDGKVSLTRLDLHLPAGINEHYGVNNMFEAEDGSFWINTTFGLVRRLPDERTIFYPYQTALIEGTTMVNLDSHNRVWLKRGLDLFVMNPDRIESLSGAGLLTTRDIKPTEKVPLQAEKEIPMPVEPGQIVQIIANDYFDQWALKNIYETSDGHIWITTEKDLLEYDGHVFRIFGSDQGLATTMARMVEDSAGNLWLGGQTSLVRLDRKGMLSYRESDGLHSARLNSINEGPDGTLYISNGDAFLSRLEGKVFTTVKFGVPPTAKSLWTSRSAFLDSRGEWWLMTNEGLFRFPATRDFASLNNRRPEASFTARNGFLSDKVYQVFEDGRGDLWVSTRGLASDSGLYRWSRAENKFYRFTEKEDFERGRSASAFAEDRNGNLWFGFYEGGLARYRDGRFTFYGQKEHLPAGVITDLLVDREGRLWASSALHGLYRLDDTTAEDPQFVSYTINEGLTSNNIRTITEDLSGNIYVGTVRGVDRFNPETGSVRHFSTSDGLAADFVVDSHCDRNGTLWFATMNGLSKLTPAPGGTAPEPQVWLGGVMVSGLPRPVSPLGNTTINPLELAHNENNFQIDFFGLDFRPGETLRYQYKLEGSNADWSTPSEQRSVTFANLSPGSYRFLVRAVNSDGTVSPEPASISFRILNPFWFRWWFVTLSTLVVGGVALAIVGQRSARRHERERARDALRQAQEDRLRELEQVRRRIAADLHDDIGSNLTRISLISEVAQRKLDGAGPPVREQLSNIGKLSRELVDSMSEIVWAINPNKDHVGDLSQRMRHFASDLLTARQIEFRFRAMDVDQNIKVGANVRREFFLVFKEAINNIVRHSGCTEVDIELGADDQNLVLIVRDNGKGFDPNEARRGHGLVTMRERTNSLGGQLEIDSADGRGTTLRFAIPLHAAPEHSPTAPA